jgi:hypothetical protein
MKKLLTFTACVLMLIACENRRSEDASTSKAPDEESSDRYKTDRTDGDKDDDMDRHSPIVKDKDRDDNNKDGGLFKKDNDEEDRVDATLANAGRSIFMSECASCHRVVDKDNDGVDKDHEKKYAGPALTDIVDRRNDRWLVKFMTNTDGTDRTDKDPEDVCRVQKKGKELNRDQALKVLEYLHQRNSEQ